MLQFDSHSPGEPWAC